MRKRSSPTAAQLLAAEGGTVPDIIAPGLKLLFCGINPSLYSAAVGHHFARPGNRFWKTLCGAGLTPRLLAAGEDRSLPQYGLGITNLVERATRAAAELSAEELAAGRTSLLAKVQRYHPVCVAVLGIDAFRSAFGTPKAALGPQPDLNATTMLWVLPNPSGLNAGYPLERLVELFGRLRQALQTKDKMNPLDLKAPEEKNAEQDD
jgi:TDG/mug DNA glycosylase family protein